ncbi:uncharacterized protein LOC126875140 [Bombus huntii]|uniref:uncharacterized protein LOC126875140 n=1 Tax=Bombus huntii TaxID=85661 RepID=UPI0021AA7508|nr:uncharacterized protein LOC126875140 [Bombus huntii]
MSKKSEDTSSVSPMATGRNYAELRLGIQSVATSEFNSIITEDASASTIRKNQPHVPKKTETKNETDHIDSEEETIDYDNPTYSAKTCLDFIPMLNGQDDIGVEGFIKRVKNLFFRTLISCTTLVLGLELIPIENNAIFLGKISKAYLYNEEVNVYIGIDVGDITNHIDTLGKHIKETQKHCTTSCRVKSEILSLTNKFNNVKTLGTHLRLLTHSKVKRGLINAIGSISKTLFGTLDSDDLQLIDQNIDKLFSEGNELKTIVTNQTALIRKILNTDSLKQLEKVNADIRNEINQVNKQELLVVKIISIESALSDLHFQLNEMFNLILLGKQGIISPQIINHHTFLEQYAKALGKHTMNKEFLPEEGNFQNILDISTLTLFVQSEKIFFKISIPTITDSDWDIEQVYPIPTQKNGAFLAPLVERPIFFTSGLTYVNVDQMYLDKQCRIRRELYICKQT